MKRLFHPPLRRFEDSLEGKSNLHHYLVEEKARSLEDIWVDLSLLCFCVAMFFLLSYHKYYWHCALVEVFSFVVFTSRVIYNDELKRRKILVLVELLNNSEYDG